MAVSSTRLAVLVFTEDMTLTQDFVTDVNADSPGAVLSLDLASGANTITVPTPGTVAGVIIVPPAGNATSMTLKGVSGDTGVPLNPAEFSSIGLASTVTTFVITTGGIILGVRFYFT